MFLNQFLMVKNMLRKIGESLLMLLSTYASYVILVRVTYLIPVYFPYTQDLPPDYSFLYLGIEMEAIVFSLD